MTIAWQVVYTELSTSTIAYLFGGARLNLTPMLAGDAIQVRMRKVVVSGGGWVNHDLIDYANAQPVNHPSVSLPSMPDVFGVEIAMRQTAGALRSIECEFFAAKILGLS